ncbi:hypothetical protein AB7M63_002801 [Bradyrhizobium japonicum]
MTVCLIGRLCGFWGSRRWADNQKIKIIQKFIHAGGAGLRKPDRSGLGDTPPLRLRILRMKIVLNGAGRWSVGLRLRVGPALCYILHTYGMTRLRVEPVVGAMVRDFGMARHVCPAVMHARKFPWGRWSLGDGGRDRRGPRPALPSTGHLDRTPIVKSPVRPAPSATTGDTYLMYVPLHCGGADGYGKLDNFGHVQFCPVLSGVTAPKSIPCPPTLQFRIVQSWRPSQERGRIVFEPRPLSLSDLAEPSHSD